GQSEHVGLKVWIFDQQKLKLFEIGFNLLGTSAYSAERAEQVLHAELSFCQFNFVDCEVLMEKQIVPAMAHAS
ncbi:hypothetical protein, partial [Escherichia coli]|uniref:hypothetical protein n=1 Tax=Escherichia coli TaxID=562 RepID=UPI00195A70E4